MVFDPEPNYKFQPSPDRKAGRDTTRPGSRGSTYLFQPSPDRKAGRDGRRTSATPCVISFNPRPTGRPGATEACNQSRSPQVVSTLARPEGRARLLIIKAVVERDQVSTLARPEGRARRDRAEVDTRPRRFNPRPTGRPGATVGSDTAAPIPKMFQPSPDRKAGRDPRRQARHRPRSSVSTLARPEGRARRGAARGRDRSVLVSTLARPEGRARHTNHNTFNQRALVSTLARPEGRARLALWTKPRIKPMWFQPSPDRKAGRDVGGAGLLRSRIWFQPSPDRKAGRDAGTISAADSHEKFQPSPDRKAGRDAPGSARRGACTSFNPRPTGRPGATVERPHLRDQPNVSTLARPEGRARRPSFRAMAVPFWFQPSPDRKAGRDPLPPDDPPPALVSTLARPEGRARPRTGGGVRQRGRGFQPSPDRKAGRDPAVECWIGLCFCFNPRPTGRPGATCPVPNERSNGMPVSTLARPEGRARP